ncbi:hypothetical protein ES288_A06G111700v1 [Gossypium darwinii]|uniref:Uncharacterized protein n=1 Tax=Gossypium darwinii TaxID=34276 RepID=A0A5D2G4D0_GOSDA|nr:hypothetical protein ES288_A06G111700v1 [Gossypium darwinii]
MKCHSIMCHPLLNSVNHSQCKVKMKFFVQAFDYDAWRIIARGPLEVPKRKNVGMQMTRKCSIQL